MTKKIRFFGSQECEVCNDCKKSFDDSNILYEFIDALDYDNAEIQKLCDDRNVIGLPHIELLIDEVPVVVINNINDVSEIEKIKLLMR